MQLADFDYHLPKHLIAQYPPAERAASRLLRVTGHIFAHLRFTDFIDQVSPGDVLIFNDTRVIKARLVGEKASGGKVEALVERVLNSHTALAHIHASNSPKPGTRLIFADRWEAETIGRDGELFELRFLAENNVFDILATSGQLPLPPYIERRADREDDERYQTIYARKLGAVAAPTAGLHFTKEMFEQLRAKGVLLGYITLHIGAGTFQPVRVDNLEEHKMHRENYEVPEATRMMVVAAHAAGRKVLAVGSTSLRALESSVRQGELIAGCGDTNLFITPGYRFKVVDRLLTNFHLPKSTLLMLVAAFAGQEEISAAYRNAVEQEYRFFSYGDAMLLDRKE